MTVPRVPSFVLLCGDAGGYVGGNGGDVAPENAGLPNLLGHGQLEVKNCAATRARLQQHGNARLLAQPIHAMQSNPVAVHGFRLDFRHRIGGQLGLRLRDTKVQPRDQRKTKFSETERVFLFYFSSPITNIKTILKNHCTLLKSSTSYSNNFVIFY